MIVVLLLGIALLAAAAGLLYLARHRPVAADEPVPVAPVAPGSNEVVFFETTVHIMAGGRAYGTLTRFSLPGDDPEAWDVQLHDADGILDVVEQRQGFTSRADAEAWALPLAQRLREHYDAKQRRETLRDLADLALQ